MKYENISAILIEHHNTRVVPFLKILCSGTINIKSFRCIKKRDDYEFMGVLNVEMNFLNEYLLMNKFIIEFLDAEVFKDTMGLLYESNPNLRIVGAWHLYKLIEEKKLEIINKLKDDNNI